jgi:hypothetical protein
VHIRDQVESLERQESLYKVGDRVVILGSRGVNGRPKGVVVTAEPDNGDGNYTVHLDFSFLSCKEFIPHPPLLSISSSLFSLIYSMCITTFPLLHTAYILYQIRLYITTLPYILLLHLQYSIRSA